MCELQPSDLQGEVKVCLDAPGYIKVDDDVQSRKQRNAKQNTMEHPKVTIVKGPCFEVPLDKADPYNPRIIPEVNDLDYEAISVSRKDLEKWPFASEQEWTEIRSGDEEPTAGVQGVEAAASKPRGRPAGSGTSEIADRPLFAEMHHLIGSGSAKSPNDAARQVAHKAQGQGTPESKQDRLARGYRRLYCSDRK